MVRKKLSRNMQILDGGPPDKKSLFSTPETPYVERYVPESIYVQQMSETAVQINNMVKMIETAQRITVEMCQRGHSWENCGANCEQIPLRAILHVPPQRHVFEMVNQGKIAEKGSDEIDTAITRAAQEEDRSNFDN